jgi:hypothetical protein
MFQKIALSVLAAGVMIVASGHSAIQAEPGQAAAASASGPTDDSQHFSIQAEPAHAASASDTKGDSQHF